MDNSQGYSKFRDASTIVPTCDFEKAIRTAASKPRQLPRDVDPMTREGPKEPTLDRPVTLREALRRGSP